jgi:hypothetical protein
VTRRATVILTVLVLAFPAPSLAQHGNVSLGAIIGYSRANLTGTDAGNLTSRAATLAGAFVRIPAASWFAVEPELLFARKGGVTAALPGQTGQLDFEFVYLETPILARFRGPKLGKYVRPFAFGGPAAAFLIGCDVQVIGTAAGQRAACDASSVPSIDATAVVGGGFEFGVGNSVLGIEVRYSLGLRRITEQDLDIRNSLWGILAEIPF